MSEYPTKLCAQQYIPIFKQDTWYSKKNAGVFERVPLKNLLRQLNNLNIYTKRLRAKTCELHARWHSVSSTSRSAQLTKRNSHKWLDRQGCAGLQEILTSTIWTFALRLRKIHSEFDTFAGENFDGYQDYNIRRASKHSGVKSSIVYSYRTVFQWHPFKIPPFFLEHPVFKLNQFLLVKIPLALLLTVNKLGDYSN